MRLIPSRVHAVMDYLVGLVLRATPFVAGFADAGAGAWVPIALGAGVIAYSLFTDYELSVSRAIPLPAHLGLDVAGGALLAISPWALGFDDRVWAPHLVIGLLEIGTALATRTVPETGPAHAAGGRRRST
jgi:SPW repeat